MRRRGSCPVSEVAEKQGLGFELPKRVHRDVVVVVVVSSTSHPSSFYTQLTTTRGGKQGERAGKGE